MNFLKEINKAYIQIGVIAVTLFLFLYTSNSIFLVLVGVEIFAMVGLEVRQGVKKHGMKHEIVDTVVALVVALAIWFGASFILNTSSPISAVASCSMLPNLERGDFVIIQGVEIDAVELKITKKDLEELSGEVTVFYNGKETNVLGSMFSYCYKFRDEKVCQDFVDSPEDFYEKRGDFTFYYSACSLEMGEAEALQPCITKVNYKGVDYYSNFSHDTIVYVPAKDEYYYPRDIVHRVFMKLDVEGVEYYLTRGDNNPVLDIQAFDYTSGRGNYPISEEKVKGKVITRIPVLGYLKLAIAGQFNEQPQCETQLTFRHVE